MMDDERSGLPPTFVEGFHDLEAVRRMEYRRLGSTPFLVSIMSLGASALGNLYGGETNEEEAVQMVVKAVKSGINLIDVAPWYGFTKAESVLGKALQQIPREAYYLSSKVGRYRPEVLQMFDFSYERTVESVSESLARLHVDKLDIVIVHDIEFCADVNIIHNETIPALLHLRQQQKVDKIGISGYPLDRFIQFIQHYEHSSCSSQAEEAKKFQLDLVLSYCRCILSDTSLLDQLPFFKQHNIGVINASPIGMGLFTERGPPVWHPAKASLKAVAKEAVEECKKEGEEVKLPKLALYFTLSRSELTTTLVSCETVAQLQDNLDLCWFVVRENRTKKEEGREMEEEEGQVFTKKDRRVLQLLRENYFEPLGNCHWEGEELQKYRTKFEKALKEKEDKAE
ncbi:D-arabinose 1-dehydrogenase [Balamuthia mandrillaris]